jgi:hypothetical protein
MDIACGFVYPTFTLSCVSCIVCTTFTLHIPRGPPCLLFLRETRDSRRFSSAPSGRIWPTAYGLAPAMYSVSVHGSGIPRPTADCCSIPTPILLNAVIISRIVCSALHQSSARGDSGAEPSHLPFLPPAILSLLVTPLTSTEHPQPPSAGERPSRPTRGSETAMSTSSAMSSLLLIAGSRALVSNRKLREHVHWHTEEHTLKLCVTDSLMTRSLLTLQATRHAHRFQAPPAWPQ